MAKGIVFRIKKFALHDGPGIRTTVFMKGCPLSCWWCHNPEGISSSPQMLTDSSTTVVGRHMSVREVMAEIEKDTLFYEQSGGGVTFSGGEPLMQPLFVEALLTACRQVDIHTAIDTAGHVPARTFARLAQMTDLILFDVKLIDPQLHLRYTGVENDLILENLETLCRTRTAVIARVPLIPKITDGIENLNAIAERLSACSGLQRVDLLPYHRIADQKYQRLGRENKMTGTEPMEPEAVAAARELFENHGHVVTIGG